MSFKKIVTLTASINIQGPAGGPDMEPPIWAKYIINS